MRDELYQRANISIHALHEESDECAESVGRVKQISIHALHEESDPSPLFPRQTQGGISIHALHEESDLLVGGFGEIRVNFNPRSP